MLRNTFFLKGLPNLKSVKMLTKKTARHLRQSMNMTKTEREHNRMRTSQLADMSKQEKKLSIVSWQTWNTERTKCKETHFQKCI